MPTGPSRPSFAPPVQQRRPPPRPREVSLEPLKEDERRQAAKRRGYASTIITRGGLGIAQTDKTRAFGV